MRKILLAFSALLALQGMWLFLPILANPGTHFSGGERLDAAQAKSSERHAALAAKLGWVRGDLWRDDVVAGTRAEGQGQGQAGRPVEISEASAGLARACHRGLSLAPLSPGLWALCARFCGNSPNNVCTGRYLKMSYYTGLYVPSVVSERLMTFARTNAALDSELQQFLDGDLRFALVRQPALKPAIIAAYRAATPARRMILSAAISRYDPPLSKEIGFGNAKQAPAAATGSTPHP